MRIAVKWLMAIALATSAFGILGWSTLDTTPRCDGEEMRPGQTCLKFGGSGGGTYEQVEENKKENIALSQKIAIGGASVFVLCGIGLYISRERRI
ncbi:hypothetical protein [Streptomyces sp. NPDC005009]